MMFANAPKCTPEIFSWSACQDDPGSVLSIETFGTGNLAQKSDMTHARMKPAKEYSKQSFEIFIDLYEIKLTKYK